MIENIHSIKAERQYETNENSENIGGWSGLRGNARDSAGADYHYDDNDGPHNRDDDNSADNHERCWNNHGIHAGF